MYHLIMCIFCTVWKESTNFVWKNTLTCMITNVLVQNTRKYIFLTHVIQYIAIQAVLGLCTSCVPVDSESKQKDRQSTRNVTLRPVCATIVAVEK